MKIREDMQPTGCSITSRTLNDAQDSDGKWFREVTTVEKCKLVPKTVEGKLTKTRLEEIIKEELKIFLKKKSQDEELDEAGKKKKKNCSPGNVFHNADGEFADKTSAKVYSLQFVKGGSDCKRGVARLPGERFTRLKCGRKSKHGPGKAKYRCKDGAEISETKS